MFTKTRIHKFATIVVALTMICSAVQPSIVSAQGGDGVKRQVNAESGRISFIGPEGGRALSASKALGTFARPQDPAMALANRFAPEFGVSNPERDLSAIKSDRSEDGRVTARFQQTYNGIPVMGGELIVNTNDRGDLYSMNGEVSPGLSLPTQPTIDSAQAAETVLQAMAKWYQASADDFVVSEPELWIYDESLLRTSTRAVELVWRMEVTSVDDSLPVRELVLVDAQRGGISLYFNQVDMAWASQQEDKASQVVDLASTELSIEDQVSTEYNGTINSSTTNMPHLAGITWYVATTGSDANDCLTTSTPCATINGAIGKATAGDTIFVAIGTYTGSGTEVVLINKSITLSGGWNAAFNTQTNLSNIDGQEVRQGILISSNAQVTLDHFTIQNGFGGGVYNYNGYLILNNSFIINNVNLGNGGGINNNSTLIINNTVVSNNTAGNPCCVGGGGGGGIYNRSGTLTLNNSLVRDNTLLGGYSGGGILTGPGMVTLNNSTVSGNTGGDGSGVATVFGDITLNNSTISFNQNYGISIYQGHIMLQNTIIAGNGASRDCYNEHGSVISQGYNLIGNSDGCFFSAGTGDIVGSGSNYINPRLLLLQDNGGSTFTHALMVGSLAIDAGNPATPGSSGAACLTTDQRGVARPVDSRCDIGAYEGSVPWVPSPIVSTYTTNNGTSLPGSFLCNQTQPNCTNGSDPQADAAHKYAIGTYNFYATKFNRDSIDNAGMRIISSVHYQQGYANAFWSGSQMVYGDAYGFPLADDMVAHELTHGVTQYESNLFYYYQSGAINESFSDLWGEYYDQTNGLDIVGGYKWRLGEDIAGFANPYNPNCPTTPALGIRDMSNPTLFCDPDKMSSPYYYEGSGDNGGVHYNSGVNNKAVYLMVDGGIFNGKTVTALGWEKTGAIYYEVNINLLVSGSDYSDLYYALQQACSNLIGQHGITSGDCIEVKGAMDAVEMNGQPAPNFNTHAPLCPASGAITDLIFSDDLESGTSNWTFSNGTYTRWQYDSPYGQYAHSGLHSLYADDYPEAITDAKARLASFVVPSNAFLHFAHAYGFEWIHLDNTSYYFDGGVLEYSTNGGSTWLDAGPLIEYNGYRGKIYNDWNNPLKGRNAFVGDSHGYISTRLNLSSLAGQNVTFRWRMGLDDIGAWAGWWVDDIKVYKCDWVGGASITADRDVIAVGRPHIGNQVMAYDGFSSGSNSMYIPMLFRKAFGGSYNAALYVQNLNVSSTANVTIKYYDTNGNLTCTINDSISALSSKGYWMPAVGCLTDGWVGGAVITSDHEIVAIGRPHIGNEILTYNGFSSGSSSMYIPMLFRKAFGGSYNAAMYVQNLNASNSANVTIKYYDNNGNLTCTVNDVIPALASHGYWMPTVSCLTDGWVGGAVVTADQDIVAIGRPHIGTQVTAYDGFPGGTTSTYVPMVYRKAGNGTYNTAIYIQNLDESSTANVSIKYYDTTGTLTCTVNDTIALLSSKGYWTPAVGCLIDGWEGSAVITADRNIVAIGRPHFGSEVYAYNGFTGGGLTGYVPMLFSNAFGGSYNSALHLQNIDPTNTANITIKFYDTNGNLSCTKTDNLAPLATTNYWIPTTVSPCSP